MGNPRITLGNVLHKALSFVSIGTMLLAAFPGQSFGAGPRMVQPVPLTGERLHQDADAHFTHALKPPPDAPSNLVATGVSSTTIALTWQDNSDDESDFHIARSPDGTGGWTRIATVGANITSYQDDGLTCSTIYYYRVRAERHSDRHHSGYSNVANASTQACPAPDLSASSKEADRPLVAPSNSLLYTIALTNTGSTAANGTRITDRLPAEVTWADNLSASSGSWGYNPASQVVTWTGTVSVGLPVTVIFQVTVSDTVAVGTVITNAAAIYDGVGTVITRTAQVTVEPMGPVGLSVEPVSSTVIVGDVLTLSIRISAGSRPVDAVDSYVRFDPAYLRVVDASGVETDTVVPGDVLPVVLQNIADNSQGQIAYSAGRQPDGLAPSGEFVLATMVLRAVGPTDETTLAFQEGTDVFYQGESVLGPLTNGIVEVWGDDTQGPVIGVPSYISATLSSEPLSVTVAISDWTAGGHGVFSATLRYGYTAPYTQSAIFGSDPGGNGDGVWTFVVPAQGDIYEGQTLRFSLEACDHDELPNCSVSDDSGSYFPVAIVDDDVAGPAVSTPVYSDTVSSAESIVVRVEVGDQATGDHGVLSATLHYGYTLPYDQYTVSGSGPGGNGDGVWAFSIPAPGGAHENQTLYFSLEACDADNSPACSTHDSGGNYFSVTVVDDDTTPPVFTNPAPVAATEGTTVLLQVDVADPSGVYDTSSNTASVYLEWDTDGELGGDVAGSLGMSRLSGNTYRADAAIGPFPAGTRVVWHVWAEDNDNSRSGGWSPVFTLDVRDDDTRGPAIGVPSYAGSASSAEAVTVTVAISDQGMGGHGVLSGTLRYGYTTPHNQRSISGSSPGGNGDGVWRFVIPAQGDDREGQTLRFSLEACDADNSPACSTHDNGGNYFSVTVLDDDTTPPVFTNPAPVAATEGTTVLLQVDVADPSGVYDTSSNTASVYLEWDTDGELGGDVAGSLGMSRLSGNTYRADAAVGPFPAGTRVAWHVWAEDNDNSRSGGWSPVFTLDVRGDDAQGPLIGVPAYTSTVPSNQSITVTVAISDQGTGGHGVLSATLRYGYTTPYNQRSVSGSSPGGNGDGVWRFVIPAQGDDREGQTLRFSLEACDADNSPACSINDNGRAYFGVVIADDDTIPPAITHNAPVTVTEGLTVLLRVDITDPSGIYDTSSNTMSVYLAWDTDGELDSDWAGRLGMNRRSGDTFGAVAAIGPFTVGMRVVWHVWAEDDDNSRSGAWSPAYYLDVVDDDRAGPVIRTPTYGSLTVSNNPITVTVAVSDWTTGRHGVLSATLRYGYTAPYNQYSVSGSGPGGNGDGVWGFVIPAQGDVHEGQTLRFFLEACDADNFPACSINNNRRGYFAVAITDDDTAPPTFTNHAPITATDSTTILLQVDVTDPSGIYDTYFSTDSVYLEWDTDGELDDDVAGRLGMTRSPGDIYRADIAIGPFVAGTAIVWHVWAEDNDNSRSGAWSPLYTLDIRDDDTQGPAIGTPSYASMAPNNESTAVTVAVSDGGAGAHGVFSATLRYGYTAPYKQHSISGSGPGGNGDGAWRFVIPAQGEAREGQTLRFYLEACDRDNSPACSVNNNGGRYYSVQVCAGNHRIFLPLVVRKF